MLILGCDYHAGAHWNASSSSAIGFAERLTFRLAKNYRVRPPYSMALS
jgi:hypothetical protein